MAKDNLAIQAVMLEVSVTVQGVAVGKEREKKKRTVTKTVAKVLLEYLNQVGNENVFRSTYTAC